jgi:carboxypeptidase T
MTKLWSRRTAAPALFSLALLALLVATANLFFSAEAARPGPQPDSARRARQSSLKARLAHARPNEFRQALAALAALDEPGALDVWEAALKNPDPQLRKEAWDVFRDVQASLVRKEIVPKVASIRARSEDLRRVARETGLDLTVWSETPEETTAAAPAYLLDRLTAEGVSFRVIYDTIADWQKSRARGEELALSVTPDYQSGSDLQVRIAVIDLRRRSAPDQGYSDWLGDRENILLRNDSFIAYLDIFSTDGQAASINSHTLEQYTRRGYALAGFFTPEEFARAVARFFPGETFDAGSRAPKRQDDIFPASTVEGRFHSYEEALGELTQIAQAHPEIARLVNLGQSYEGRQIFALKITTDPSVDDSSKPDVLITGGHHAREWIAVEPPIFFANQLANGYATDDTIKHTVDNLRIWIVPILNPDGLTYSQGSANEQTDPVRLWRKNRRPISDGDCGASVGIDLNRNYDFQWRLPEDEACPKITDDIGASDDPRNEIYRGPKPNSEPEVKAIQSLMDDPTRHFRALIDYHNYSQLVLYPWGYQPHPAPDERTLSMLAEKISSEIFARNRKIYTPQQAVDLYATTGSSIDYAYGAHNVAAPFVIEMRPTCCKFNVAESEIADINEENWSGARAILKWSAGPPILESVKAYQAASGGSFTKLVYSARWLDSTDATSNARQMVVDTRFPGIEPGRLQVRLQFSKPMNTASTPQAFLGRDEQINELRLLAPDEASGWQKTIYLNDTWVGEAIIPNDENTTSAWRLAVSAIDLSAFDLDAMPQTIPNYGTGTGRWNNYEDTDGAGATGGVDRQHIFSPTLNGVYPSLFVGSPAGGERLVGGELYTVAWTVPRESGFIPVHQEIWLSVDGGVNFAPLLDSVPGNADKAQITLPKTPTTRARVRILAREGSFGNTLFGDSLTDFSICTNVGSGLEVAFISSERIDRNWSDAPSADYPNGTGGSSQLTVNLKLTNRSQASVANPLLRVAELSRTNVLLTRESRSNPTSGSLQLIDTGDDNVLSPGESVDVRLMIGLVVRKKFNLSVEFYGVPVGGVISPSGAVNVWKGKPKNK